MVGSIRSVAFKTLHPSKEKFKCPICCYAGPLIDFRVSTGFRESAQCPKCWGLERHRLQWLALNHMQETMDFSRMDMIHFAPEPFLRHRFQRTFKSYTTADLTMSDVHYQADLTRLPLKDGCYDVVYASHVLEHISTDDLAISEIRRILRPNGIAILPVPIIGASTIEYPQPNPIERGHVRAPGLDYYNRYREVFSDVRVFRSAQFDPVYQVFVYEDRSHWPTPEMPLRQPAAGFRHEDFVPVCLV